MIRSLAPFTLLLLFATNGAAQSRPDFSGVDRFWDVVERLAADGEPTPEAWRRLFDAPAYRQLNQETRLQRLFRVAYQPSAEPIRDSILKTESYEADVLKHLRLVPTERAALQRFRDSLATIDLVTEAGDLAQAYLPPGQINRRDPPPIAFGVFGPEAYGAAVGITVDLLFARDRGAHLVPLVAHEVHHVHVDDLTGLRFPERSAPAFRLLQALRNLANEGTADRINLRFPVGPPAMIASASPAYNAAYDDALPTLLRIDTLLTAVGDDTAAIRRVGAEVSVRLVYAGHPVGAYMAERIEKVLGRQALIVVLGNPFAFVRSYNEAEGRSSGRRPFTPASLALVASLESRFYSPSRH